MRIDCVDPGRSAIDLNAFAGTRTLPAEAPIIIRKAQAGGDDPTGGSIDVSGVVPR